MSDVLRNSSAEISAEWDAQLKRVVETVREMSEQSDPQAMVNNYRDRVQMELPVDNSVSLSRRGLAAPAFRITRSSRWEETINPWKQSDRLPHLQGGLLGELIWADEPRIIDDVQVAPTDPAYEYLAGHRSLMALPLFDRGSALNMVVMLRRERAAFAREDFPNLVLTSNLFGRAAHNLVLADELRGAYKHADDELRNIAEIQRDLLPQGLPEIATMQLAAHYRSARRAGGDYYDFFPLPDNKWGILVADVAGHGADAAVLMAITRSLAHADLEPTCCPGHMLCRLNDQLHRQYTSRNGKFVTAFYGVYDEAKRELVYASAGHHPPRVKRCEDGTLFSLDGESGLPLGVIEGESYVPATQVLRPGDQVIFFTDGITERMNNAGEMFGQARVDAALSDCMLYARDLIKRVLDAVEAFAAGRPPDDDQTVLVAKIT